MIRAWLDARAEEERPAANARLVYLIIGYTAAVGLVLAVGFAAFMAAALGVFRG